MMHFEAIPYKNDPIIQFAVDEFVRYIKMAKTDFSMGKGKQQTGRPRSQFQYCIGLIDDLAPEAKFDVDNPEIDDGIYINAWNGSAIIAGVNARSTLIAVYRFLYELGFRWSRPGDDGLIVPKSIWQVNMLVNVHEKASFRYRSVQIEEATTENMIDIIDWLPKLGYNSFYVYDPDSHTENSSRREKLATEICKRGLLFHAPDHVWTSGEENNEIPGWRMS